MRLAEIQAHLSGMSELLGIVGAMRALSGMRIQEAQQTLPGIRRYAQTVATGIADTLLLMDEPEPSRVSGRTALILCTAEHGFVGSFRERLAEAGQAAGGPDWLLFVLGTRGAALMVERGRQLAWTHHMATRCAAAPEIVQSLSAELYSRISRGDIARVELIFARYRQGAAPSIERRLLLPLDLAFLATRRPRQPPLHNLNPVALHEKLLAEYVFALLTEAVVESIASENAARLAAMEAARENVSRKVQLLRQNARQVRQSEITGEILELSAATQAIGRVPGRNS